MTLSFKNITKLYNGVSVLKSINIENIHSGDCVGIVGKNGAGKTTFLNFLADLIPVESGSILLDNKNIFPESLVWKEMIGLVSNEVPLPEDFSGEDYLEFIRRIYGIESSEFNHRYQSLIDFFFNDASVLKRKIGSYSLGMKKKISLCGAVLNKPKILILDEPFSGLDVEGIDLLQNFLQMYRTKDHLILLTSHNLGYVNKLLTRVIIIDNGVVKFDDTPQVFTHNGNILLYQALYDFLTIETKTLAQLDWVNK